ncbi:MAG: LysR family transcriptional regulator, partial [Pseudomonadota bacterium]
MNIAFYIRHMKNIHINSLDLKLLKVFRAVFEEGSVTKAAARLSLEQSQISHLLNRLRKTLGDPLFVRSGRSIAPTERAIVIAPSVQAIIEQIESLGETAALDLSVLTDTFTISANDYERRLLAPILPSAFSHRLPARNLS